MDLETLKALGPIAGYPLGFCIFAWFVGPAAGEALKAKAEQWRASQAGRALDQFNGKLVAKFAQSLKPAIEEIVDARFGEFPEFMRQRVVEVVQVQLAGVKGQLEEQCERLDRVESGVGTANAGIARIEGRLQGQAEKRG